jgi:hypothetical protein
MPWQEWEEARTGTVRCPDPGTHRYYRMAAGATTGMSAPAPQTVAE